MHINKTLLFTELQGFIEKNYLNTDKELLLELCRKIIDTTPQKTVSSKVSAAPGEDCRPIRACFTRRLSAAYP
jgi:hypothetical protein